MKPQDKADAVAQYNFSRLDDFKDVDNGYKQDEKRIWKKRRTRRLRSNAKKELRERLKELEP
jgi:hypothetical protein